MSYACAPAPVGSKGFDTVETVTAEQAAAMVADGFRVACRYATAVTDTELAHLTGAGLGVLFVLYSPRPGYQPSAELGASMAKSGCDRMRALGVPAGCTLVIDLETMGGAPAERIAHANAGADVIAGCGFVPGAYVGDGVGLTSAELYALRVHRYWKSMSRVQDAAGAYAEPACGWCAVQLYPPNIDHPSGLRIDVDFFGHDYAGRSMGLCVAA